MGVIYGQLAINRSKIGNIAITHWENTNLLI